MLAYDLHTPVDHTLIRQRGASESPVTQGIVAANNYIDEQIEVMQKERLDGMPAVDMQERKQALRDLGREAMLHDQEYQLKNNQVWYLGDYYRLLGRMAFMDEIVETPRRFHVDAQRSEREELVNGIAGVSADLLSNVFETLRTPGLKYDGKTRLHGVVRELSVLSLLNRSQDPDMIALPASAKMDINKGTDIEWYRRRPNGSTLVSRIDVTTRKLSNASDRGVIPIYANAMGRICGNGMFKLAKMLERENVGEAAEHETEALDRSSERLLGHLAYQSIHYMNRTLHRK